MTDTPTPAQPLPPTLRLFVAIPLPEPLRAAIGRLQGRFRREGVRAGLVPPENLHLSLQFLGDVPSALLPPLHQQLAAVATRFNPFELTVGQLGRFGPPDSPRVIWLGTTEPEVLGQLALAVRQAAQQVALTLDERPFKAHITLARVRHAHQHAPMRHALEHVRIPQLGSFPVDAFHLIRTQLTPNGTRHLSQARFPLTSHG
jgi:2'-5' RNA ligase